VKRRSHRSSQRRDLPSSQRLLTPVTEGELRRVKKDLRRLESASPEMVSVFRKQSERYRSKFEILELEEIVRRSVPVKPIGLARDIYRGFTYPPEVAFNVLKDMVCRERKERRESLFAGRRIGKGKGGPKFRLRTPFSSIRC